MLYTYQIERKCDNNLYGDQLFRCQMDRVCDW